ncbi:4-diphosphocytidyl-2C-methyl-D-erythritol kinase [Roseibium aquae]|uniref:4-diphosphocytidyl-2C-methyl-D-erythritol kinase n=1 Tax=Roseibium aquae TaxID=1323746 RepID=A0A916TJP2_9HYPH|nr:molybdopterin-binding/glycosyltransferase family 2 protein [Roseibium aquae]GGB47392.1 4-diphosphocytidyl-2C-methyl-D-erythritol kinase [Roseibium aquae]
MEFGPIPVSAAVGTVLAHSTRIAGRTLKKGHVLSAEDCGALRDAGIAEIVVARLAHSDIDEDTAAHRIALAASATGLVPGASFTGRVNLHAGWAGLFVADEAAVDAVNRIDPAITLATLSNYTPVGEGRMVATSKIIPFAVSEGLVRQAESRIEGALAVHPFKARKIGLVATELPHLKPGTMDKTRRVLEDRLRPSGSTVLSEKRVPHTEAATAAALAELDEAGAELLILFGASAVVDRQDILPGSIEKAGGKIIHFGMPVDPGNLLLLGELHGKPVLGAPGCARSPKENGFDWVLDRLLADLPVTSHDITGMGVGGLLMEIESRPQPRDPGSGTTGTKIAAIILAAGRSSRMIGQHKLLADLNGKPVLQHTIDAALGADLSEIIVVTGYMDEEIGAAIAGQPVRRVHNGEYETGMASSIRTGISALAPDTDAAIILLADMPNVTAIDLSRLVAAFLAPDGAPIVSATSRGERGNPVLWDKRYFGDLSALEGDKGARDILKRQADQVFLVEIGDAARIDLDTFEDLTLARTAAPRPPAP